MKERGCNTHTITLQDLFILDYRGEIGLGIVTELYEHDLKAYLQI